MGAARHNRWRNRSIRGHVDEFILIGAPFAVFLIAAVWAGHSIGRAQAGFQAAADSRAALRGRVVPATLTLLAAALAVVGAAAAAAAGAFARLTDAGFAIEPTALILILEAGVDLALAAVAVAPGWSPGRAWTMRTIGVYWLCLAIPTMILADGGAGWISTTPDPGMTLLGLPSFGWEAVAVVLPALLLWRASLARTEPEPDSAVSADATSVDR
jgi:hypothetical protein